MTHIEVGVAILEKWVFPARSFNALENIMISITLGLSPLKPALVYLANQLSRLDLSGEDEEELISDILSTIPNWEKSKCTSEQIAIACRLAYEQCLLSKAIAEYV
ncbi:MAG: hypothetical protein IIB69_11930 [Proteobacteria bacterium]|nr:hypothetical protein [Pseudomonadota bacterium]